MSLYKSFLARHLSKGLKNGTVYVNTSHEFKAIDTYLIDEKTWQEQKMSLLERANLRYIESWGNRAADFRISTYNLFQPNFRAN